MPDKVRVTFYSSHILLLLMGVLIVYLMVDFGREVVVRNQRREDLGQVEQLIQEVQARNSALEKLVQYNLSPAAAEAWGREQGLAMPGEVPVVIVAPQSEASPTVPQAAVDNPAQVTNRDAWWALFFGEP
jgi:cell division protein FtsB